MGLYETLANCDPKLRAGIVHCEQCGKEIKVNSAECFRTGWPKCCNGYTMTLGAKPKSKVSV